MFSVLKVRRDRSAVTTAILAGSGIRRAPWPVNGRVSHQVRRDGRYRENAARRCPANPPQTATQWVPPLRGALNWVRKPGTSSHAGH